MRDCDGGVTQFLYGEDGIDPVKQLGLKWLSLMADNTNAVAKGIRFKVLDSMDRNTYRDTAKKRKKIAQKKGADFAVLFWAEGRELRVES